MPTSGSTPWSVGVLAVRSAKASVAVELCPYMFTLLSSPCAVSSGTSRFVCPA
jgi:hypothetical protein